MAAFGRRSLSSAKAEPRLRPAPSNLGEAQRQGEAVHARLRRTFAHRFDGGTIASRADDGHHYGVLTEGEVTLIGVGARSRPTNRSLQLVAAADGHLAAPRISTEGWRLALMTGDLIGGGAAVALAIFGRFGVNESLGPTAPYAVLLAAGPFVWVALLLMNGAYDDRRLGTGASEFGKVVNAGLWMLGVVIGVSYVAHAEISREVVAVTIVGITALGLTIHLAGRRLLQRRIRIGAAIHRVVVVGSAVEVRGLVRHMARLPNSGLRVVGYCVPEASNGHRSSSVVRPHLIDNLIEAASGLNADTVAIAGSTVLSGQELRRLSWDLEGSGMRLMVAPDVSELAGPRLIVHPVGGLPLLHVREAEFGGASGLLKAAMDRVGATVLTVALCPVFAAIAIAVRLSGPGPILFRQTRVGLHGRDFTLLKFRTMQDGAERLRDTLLGLNEHDGVLFKLRRDPRVTRVGRFLRRYSLDELPQLWNVLTGSMSLVGPRPPLRSEVERYPEDLRRRRLLVKPGVTGLWQVSGRADLSWDESVHLDLQYVENWSPVIDMVVLWKTLQAVVSGRGAY
jgi:exopolysaccharide biosynthesis polyprenyl glycosylphosphotransferase